ncbi:MAG: beta strand repeat-containing protein [Miltoncostaeaceae bacterium]
MWIRRLVTAVGAISLLVAGLALVPTPAQAAGTDQLFWVGSTTTPVADGLFGATAATVPSATNLGSQAGLYRTLATDGTYLYFSDGTNLVRTGLDGTGKTTVVAGVPSPEQVTFAGNYLYFTLYNGGVYGVSLAILPASASQIFTVAGGGWNGVTVSGNTIYAINNSGSGAQGVQGLYSATLNGVSAVTATMIDASAVMTYGATKIYASAGKIYAAGSTGSIKVRDASGVWTSVSVADATGQGVYSVSVIDTTIYFSTSSAIGSVSTGGTGATILTSGSQFTGVWCVTAAPPTGTSAYTVTYNSNGASSGSVPIDYGSPYFAGSTVAVLGNTGTLTKTDNQFYGYWGLDGATSGTLKAPGSTFTISQNTTLYAQWVGGPLAYSLSSGGPIVTTSAFPATANGQTSEMTVYMRNTGATTYPNVANGGGGVGAPISSTCPSGGGTAFLMNAECQFTLRWTASGNLSNTFSYSYGGPSPAYLTLTGTMLNAARTPTFSAPVGTVDGYTVNVTNWDANWTWTPSVGSGSVAAGTGSGSTLPLTVSGLGASASATITMQTARSGYADGSATVTSSALTPARTPTFDTPVPTLDGYTVNVTNWDTNWTWTPSVGSGAVTAGAPSGALLPLTVTGLAAGVSATVTTAAGRTGYVTGTATVSGTAKPASGGGGGGSSASTDTPTTPTTPTTPPIVTPSTPEPLGPQDSPTANTLQPGGTDVTVGGTPVTVTTTPVPKTGSVAGTGDGWTVTVGGRTPAGGVEPLTSAGDVQIPQGGGVHVSGSGYQPGTTVAVYAMNPALLLGTFTVGADGSFASTVTLPAGISAGNAVIQVNGYASAGVVRSYSLGVKVARVAGAKVLTVKRTVYFAAGSSWLSPTTKSTLADAVKAVPKGAKSVSVVCTGNVQGTSDTSNDFTLSTARATNVAAQLKADKLVGKYYVTGRGIAKESGALGRKVIVTVTYR